MNPLMTQLHGIRKESGLGQGKVAKIAGYHRARISQWENGKCDPSLSNFENLANALGYDVVLVRRKDSEAA